MVLQQGESQIRVVGGIELSSILIEVFLYHPFGASLLATINVYIKTRPQSISHDNKQ